MECNKEEAMRAKDIAQKKMESKDFPGARKFALKAQQLYPVMENISQMLCVCDVHCSAESKMFGSEMDWYGILQVNQSADDAFIKKQYRKFALLLHPDKNKFSGAEAAFKLIGEAQRVLLDKEKRSYHDMRRKSVSNPVRPNQPSQQASRNAVKTSKVQNNYRSNSNSHAKGSNAASKEPQQAQSGVPNGRETFWTQCPYCGIRYQYYKEILNRALRCQSCKKPFIAYDMLSQGARPGADATQPVFPGHNVPNVNASNPGSEAMKEKHASNAGWQSGKLAQDSRSQNVKQSQKGSSRVDSQVEDRSKSFRKVNGKRGKRQEEDSSDSFGSDSSLESEEVEIQTDTTQQFDSDGDGRARRSSRNKRHVSYNEDASDEEIMNPAKKAKEHEATNPTTEAKVGASEKRPQSDPSKASASATLKESKKGELNKSDGIENDIDLTKNFSEAEEDSILSSSPGTTPDPEFHEYPDPEFFDFDKQREEQCFKVGQVWAAYDTADAMPRFYAKIRKIFSPGFKLRITWLEANPDDPCLKEWVESDLPYSCGKFKLGSSENTEDRLMFSHEVTWEKGGAKDSSVLIYPRKGQIWGMFKNWDANWHSIPEKERKFEYKFVEVVSDFDRSLGIRVVELGKVKGFASLFCQKGGNELRILPSELLMFSHEVPSHKMKGDEKEGVPKNSFELDPASISMNLEEIAVPQANGNSSGNLSDNFGKVKV